MHNIFYGKLSISYDTHNYLGGNDGIEEEIDYDEEKEEILAIRRAEGFWAGEAEVERYKPSQQVADFLMKTGITYEDIYGTFGLKDRESSVEDLQKMFEDFGDLLAGAPGNKPQSTKKVKEPAYGLKKVLGNVGKLFAGTPREEKKEDKQSKKMPEAQSNRTIRAMGIEDWREAEVSSENEEEIGRTYSLEYFKKMMEEDAKNQYGQIYVRHDTTLGKWRMQIPLERSRYWFLTVFLFEDGRLNKYYLDYEDARDMHYAFHMNASQMRNEFGKKDDEYFHDALIRYMENHNGWELKDKLRI